MSRVGKQIIIIPSGVEVKQDGNVIVVKGPKGQLMQELHKQVRVEIADGKISVKIENENDKSQRALWGLFAVLIKNMVTGVTAGFTKDLEINGVGFKAIVMGRVLNLSVGFSHKVDFKIPDGIEIKVEGNKISVSGFDKQLVGETAAQIRKTKKPEPYKGKGIKYATEKIRRKAGKAAGAKK